MATKKDTKKKKVTNPYDFFIKGRSRKAIEMDYSMKAKPPSSKEKRVNRTDYPGENLYYLEYFKKHNITPPKKATKKKTTTKKTAAAKKTTTKKTAAKKTTTKKTAAAKKTTTKKTTAAKKTTTKKTAAKKQLQKKNDIKVTDKTSKKEILDKLSPIRAYQSPLQSIHYNKNDMVIEVTDNPNCFAHPYLILLDRNKNEIDKWLEKYSNRREIQYETVIKTLKNNSKSEQLLPIKFIELIELDEEEKYTFAYLKSKYIAIVEIDNKKYVANPYLLKWLIKENYNIYAKKEILQDNFDTDFYINTDFIIILKKNDEIKGLISGLIYKDKDLTNIYREKNKIETSETTKKVSKKTPVKKSTTKISNPKDYPTLMAMRVKEKIIKDHNRCDFTKEEIEEAVDLSIRRGNETQAQIVKDAINILFATSKGH